MDYEKAVIDIFNYSPWISINLNGKINDNNQIEYIKSLGSIRKYKKGTIIIQLGEKVKGLYFIIKGQAEGVCMSDDGEEKIVLIFNPPSFFAEAPFLNGLGSNIEIRATEDSIISYIDENKINKIIDSNNVLVEILFKSLSKKTQILVDQLNDVLYSSTEKRVIKALRCFARERGIYNKNNFIIKVKQEEIAQVTGLHRVTIARVLSRLKKAGMIKYINKTSIMLLNRSS